jgi:hypothetical protein
VNPIKCFRCDKAVRRRLTEAAMAKLYAPENCRVGVLGCNSDPRRVRMRIGLPGGEDLVGRSDLPDL